MGDREELERVMCRVNFVLNTSRQHVTPAPPWVLQTLRGENPQVDGPPRAPNDTGPLRVVLEIPRLVIPSPNITERAHRMANVREQRNIREVVHRETFGALGSRNYQAEFVARRGSTRRVLSRTGSLAILPADVTLTRIAFGAIDSHDNLRSSLKRAVDAVADALGLANDSDPRISWSYREQRAPRGVYGLRIEIVPRSHPA